MIKSVIKFSIVFVLTIFMALGAASTAYIVTKRITNSGNKEAKEESLPMTDSIYAQDKEVVETKATIPDYYMVRLEGETLGVYAQFSEREDFLYNAEVYKTNLSAEDIRLLTSGIRLESHADLVSFIEDYTS